MTVTAHAEYDASVPVLFVNPNFLEVSSAQTHEVVNPATLKVVGSRISTPAVMLNEVVVAANDAQREWRMVDAKTRAGVLHQLAHSIETRIRHDVAKLMTEEMGKPYPEAIGELQNCAQVFRYYAELARDDAGKIAGTTERGSFQYARYESLGVSVHIMPFNFPILLMCWTVAASLAAGNACIVKPAQATTLCTLKFMSHFRVLPEGLVSCVPGGATQGDLLVRSEHTHAVAFTGSVAAGRAIASTCGDLLKPCIIEAGGSDPMLVTAHAPLDVAAAGCVTAAFHLSGQVCTSAERIFVVDSVHDEFVHKLVERTRALRIGDGFSKAEIGPLVSEAARDRVAMLVADAVRDGATLVCGGRIPSRHPIGWFYEPTILTDVTQAMAIAQQECFGPVAAIVRVADFDEGIARANDSTFGLGASVFTTDLSETMEATERLQAGMVWVNNPLIDNDALPFGGCKRSGVGRELGRQGLEAFRQSKMVVIDHNPVIKDWWYPYPDAWFYGTGGRGDDGNNQNDS